MNRIIIEIFLLLPTIVYIVCNPHLHQPNKERIEDGFQSSHYVNGEHNNEFDHEAVLGSKTKAKEFDTLSPSESKRRLRLLVINGMDINKDGFVDREELIDWVIKSFNTLAIEDGKERLEEEDFNRDRFVTWDEHLRDSFDIEDNLDDDNLLRDELMAEDKALWQTADLNADGKLDINEFAAFNSPEEFEHMHHTIYTQMMIKRDKNKDGFLDLIEYSSDVNGNPPDPKSEHFITEKDRFHSDYDIDGDGKLNEKECLLWLIPDNRFEPFK
jgi:Ca2+-binding EF-hand superfamily protein